ncbi:MAG: hypothetical protein RL021_2036 [Bacteroidota bacterium]
MVAEYLRAPLSILMQLIHTDDEDELLALISLSMLPGIGSVMARQLITHFGTAAEVLRARKSVLERIPGIGRERADAVIRSDVHFRAEQELLFIKRHNVQVLSFLSPQYPRRLRQCNDAPVVLYSKGNASLNSERVAAVIGTRKITANGRSLVEELVRLLSAYGVTVVSGLAYGVDIAAHRSSLEYGNPTIAVVAHGMDRIYPSVHRSVAEQMLDKGGLITEFPSGTRPDRDNFPARNRIVAGMTDATIVIESAERGGALITAMFANDYNRDVFAFPGRPSDEFSRGCNMLIRTNRAMLVDNGVQIIEMMNWERRPSDETRIIPELPLFDDVPPVYKEILQYLKDNGMRHLDEIAWNCRLPVSKASALLLEMEFKGWVKPAPGKVFRLV